jgi:ACS family sodium-dependent inorganic phosphate cotransporter
MKLKRHNIVLLIFFSAFICYIDRVNISVAIIPMQEAFGWSDTTKGFVLSSFFIGYMVMQIPSGWLANKFGGKLVLGIAVLSWSLFTLLTPLAVSMSFTFLIAVRIAMGMGEAAMFPGAISMYRTWIPVVERSRAVGYLISGIPLGTLFALMTTGWIVTRFGWPFAFYSFGFVGFIWVAIWYYKSTDDPKDYPGISEEELNTLEPLSADKDADKDIPWKKMLSHRAVQVLFFNHFCVNWGLYIMLAWLPSYFRDTQSLSITEAGFYSAAPWLTMFITTNIASRIADRLIEKGHTVTFVRKLMQCCGLFGGATFFLLVQYAQTPLMALTLMCGTLCCIAITWSGWGPNPLDLAPRYADVLSGISSTFANIPGIVGVALTGWLLDQTGSYSTIFVLTAMLQIVAGVLWLKYSTGEPIVE